MKRRTLTFVLVALTMASLLATTAILREDTLAGIETIDVDVKLAPNQLQWADEISISLLTVGPGDPLYAWFGHSALIVRQPNGTSIMYDWGIFDASQEHFYLNFARGRMYYYVWASNSEWRIAEAIEEGRDVRLIELDLTAQAKWALSRYLGEHISGEYSTYLYHFYDDNCATRIRDLIDVATGGAFGRWARAQSTGLGARALTAAYMNHRPLIAWTLSTLQGRRVDRTESLWDAMFLPQSLEAAVAAFQGENGSSLVKSATVLATRTTPQRQVRTSSDLAAILALTITLLLVLLWAADNDYRRIVLGLAYGLLAILGSLLLFMMLYSDMDMTYYNLNILLINPILFIPSYMMLARRRTSSTIITLFAGATIILILARLTMAALFVQDNLATLVVVLPLYLSGATFQRRGDRKALKGRHRST